MGNTNRTDSDDPRIKGEEIMRHINAMKDVLDIMWTTENYNSPREKFYYTIFLKILYILDGIHINIFNLDNKPHYSFVVVLSLRTAMLDILNLYYVMDVHEDNAKVETRINSIMSDHIKNVYKTLSVEDREKVYKLWPHLFNESKLPKVFDKVRTSDLIKGIKRNRALIDEAKEIHHIYNLFSKYEHNGVFTFDIVHNIYQPGGNKIEKSMIYYAISACAIAGKLVASHWLENDSPLLIKLSESVENLQNFNFPKKD